ncbi:helix-turn-helix domain-containing protein [Gordonia sp. ABSL1-1]|uniref:winged helix-turn-helix transcriptional regulator n=1 Tax=Gordonia sp. ABSL1-1 TaxID=3053923 RepID=UPI0025728A45|nr:helix-turn-helix domain-containing protein [Gordonia sp. ABSL1-1]MDL9938732.1 helix-turn-helix domain-containing protein [Gordonia sp. ABSL1-1]
MVRPALDDDTAADLAAQVARRALARPDADLTVADLAEGAQSIRAALETVGGIWPMLVLAALGAGPQRYGELKRIVVGINDRMLSQTLHRLVRDGVAHRQVVEARRSCVEYELTALGVEVRESLTDFLIVVLALAPRVAQARKDYDDANPDEVR